MAEDKIAQAYFRLFYLMDKIKTLDNFITPHCKYKLNKRSPFTNIPLFSDLEMSFFYFFFDFYFWFQYIKYCKKLKHQIRSIWMVEPKQMIKYMGLYTKEAGWRLLVSVIFLGVQWQHICFSKMMDFQNKEWAQILDQLPNYWL